MSIEYLSDALDTLKDRLTNNSDGATAVIETAEEYGLNPQLLSRKFTEAYGTTPAQYTPPTDLKTRLRRLARKRALDTAWDRFTLHQSLIDPNTSLRPNEAEKQKWQQEAIRQRRAGVIFVYQGQEYAFSHLVSDGGSRCIAAIPVEENEDALFWMIGNAKLTFGTEQDAYTWLTHHTIRCATEAL